MNFTIPNMMPALPEIVLLALICVVLLVDVFLKQEHRYVTYVLSLFTILATLFAVCVASNPTTDLTFGGSYIRDSMGDILKISLGLVTAAVFVYSHEYIRKKDIYRGEYYILGLFALLGMMIMVSAYSMLNIYLGLELLSLSLYAMVAFDRNNSKATEAAMKYFVLGAIASGLLLYGMSILYGITGSLNITEISAFLQSQSDQGLNKPLVFAMVFVLIGLAFKLGAVPFHMWIPDVYHGAPTSVTMLVGSAPKIAAFAMIMRLLVDGLGSMHADWQGMLIILAVLSLSIGNVVAIAQTNIKRMLAYSTISHVGFILLGLLAGTKEGYAAAMFYVITYAIMAVGAFGIIALISRKGFDAEEITDFKGLNNRYPWLALMFMIILLSMAGVPPTVGFYSKLMVLRSVIDINMVWLAIFAVIFSVIGAYYYLKVIKTMYFDEAPESVANVPIETKIDEKVMISINGVMVLLLGIFPGSLMAICIAAITTI